MKFGIQEGVLLSLLDTKFPSFPVQNYGMTSDQFIIIILREKIPFRKLGHIRICIHIDSTPRKAIIRMATGNKINLHKKNNN